MAEATLKEIREFFNSPDRPMTLSTLKVDWNDLTEQDRTDLKAGIGNGTLTY